MNKYLLEDYKKDKYKKNQFKLLKKNDYNNAIIVLSNELIKTTTIADKEMIKEKIKYFLMTLHQKCNNFKPDLFIKNYKKTMFQIKCDNNSINKSILGRVLMLNPIRFYIRTFDVVNHELLHLSSIKKDIYDDLFIAYDEAYTQLLAERYFDEKVDGLFDLEVLIMKNIEIIVGKDLMETKFFEGKLYSTIKELYKYESKEKIDNLLLYLNKIYLLRGKSNVEKEIQVYLDKIFMILVSCLKQKHKDFNYLKRIINVIEQEKLVGTYSYNILGNNAAYIKSLLDEGIIEDLKQNVLEQKKKIINR